MSDQTLDPEPVHPGPKAKKMIHLPALLADEFGTDRSTIRMALALGTLEIDGQEWTGDKMDLPYEAIAGKEIIVVGKERRFKMIYRG